MNLTRLGFAGTGGGFDPLAEVRRDARCLRAGRFAEARRRRSRRLAVCAAVSFEADRAVLFDCDGVILESESLHREAYNQAFREFDVAYNWSPEYYDELQNTVGGGKPKMRYYFGIHGWPNSKIGPPPATEEGQANLVDQLQDCKTAIYKGFVSGKIASLRPGVARLMDQAIAEKEARAMRLAICSASTKESCLFVLENLVGPDRLANFDVILAGDDVKNKKPNPEIYNLALDKMPDGISPERCVVIEDSLIGLQAAKDAGMRCLITHTDSTASQDFSKADMVVPELGDDPNINVTLDDLLGLIDK